MPGVERSEHETRIATELHWCYTYEPGTECRGASGRKLRQICTWCPNYRRTESDHHGHAGNRGSIGPAGRTD